MSPGHEIPGAVSALSDEALAFAIEVIDASKVAERIEEHLVRSTGRPRLLEVRCLLVALLALALDDRPLHLKAATRLLFCDISEHWRRVLGVRGEATTKKCFLARYRQVRYLFHLALSVADPSVEAKNRVVREGELASMRKGLSEAEIALRRGRLETFVSNLIEASVRVASDEELCAFDGSVGLDATVLPLFSRGPSTRTKTCASDPDGAWYVREGDHRDVEGPSAKKLRKLFWALEATIGTMGRPPGAEPTHPNLVLAACLGRPGEDPGGTGVRMLASVRKRGWPARRAGADRGYTQTLPERFHLPARALGYDIVIDYRADQLGRQANSHGAVMVDGSFYCPAMPEPLVTAGGDQRAGVIEETLFKERIDARRPWRLVRKQGPDHDGYERFCCPAQGEHPHLCCPLRPGARALGKVPVTAPPEVPPRVCTQSSVTIAPDVGARHRQDLAYGSEEWARVYATYRNTIEGTNGFVKDPAHESLQAPGRRRVRGIAAQSLFMALLIMSANVRKIRTFREMAANDEGPTVAQRARRRRMSITDYRPPPPSA